MAKPSKTEWALLDMLAELDEFEMDRLRMYLPKLARLEEQRRLEAIEADRESAVEELAEWRRVSA